MWGGWFGVVGMVLAIGCAQGGGGGGGGGQPVVEDNENVNDNAAEENENAAEGGTELPGAPASFTAGGCGECHTTEANNFSDSSVDDIVDTLLDEQPHPGGEFGELSEDDIDEITDFLVELITGEGVENDNEAEENENAAEDNDNETGGESQTFADFEQVWMDFNLNYSHFEDKGVGWGEIYEEYAPRFEDELPVDEFLSRLADMLAELRDIHVWLFDPDGEPVEVFSRVAAQNFPGDDQELYFPDGVTPLGTFPLVHARLAGNIAYIGIDSFENERWAGLRTGDIDALFATYADADALILDVRRNNGGNEIIAATIAGHLTDVDYVYGYHRTKIPGEDHNDFGPFEAHELLPAENELFLKPTACLIGEVNLSSAEWWVLMMQENPRGITLIGGTTRGSSGFPQEFTLDNGITYHIPSWEAFWADQVTRIEDVGIPPTPGFEISPEESFTSERDFVLERAIELLSE